MVPDPCEGVPGYGRFVPASEEGGLVHYDRQGLPISFGEWGALFDDEDYRRIALTEVGPVRVSTVWLGIDHRFGEGPPIIFETMVFGCLALLEYQTRACTENEALAQHAHAVALVEATGETA